MNITTESPAEKLARVVEGRHPGVVLAGLRKLLEGKDSFVRAALDVAEAG